MERIKNKSDFLEILGKEKGKKKIKLIEEAFELEDFNIGAFGVKFLEHKKEESEYLAKILLEDKIFIFKLNKDADNSYNVTTCYLEEEESRNFLKEKMKKNNSSRNLNLKNPIIKNYPF